MSSCHWSTTVHRAMMTPLNADVMMIGHFAKDRLVAAPNT